METTYFMKKQKARNT